MNLKLFVYNSDFLLLWYKKNTDFFLKISLKVYLYSVVESVVMFNWRLDDDGDILCNFDLKQAITILSSQISKIKKKNKFLRTVI